MRRRPDDRAAPVICHIEHGVEGRQLRGSLTLTPYRKLGRADQTILRRFHIGPEKEGVVLKVDVRDNNVDQALRALKKKLQREGVFREMKARRAYEKPSERRAREKQQAIRRSRKLARKQAQREGLIPGAKRKVAGR